MLSGCAVDIFAQRHTQRKTMLEIQCCQIGRFNDSFRCIGDWPMEDQKSWTFFYVCSLDRLWSGVPHSSLSPSLNSWQLNFNYIFSLILYYSKVIVGWLMIPVVHWALTHRWMFCQHALASWTHQKPLEAGGRANKKKMKLFRLMVLFLWACCNRHLCWSPKLSFEHRLWPIIMMNETKLFAWTERRYIDVCCQKTRDSRIDQYKYCWIAKANVSIERIFKNWIILPTNETEMGKDYAYLHRAVYTLNKHEYRMNELMYLQRCMEIGDFKLKLLSVLCICWIK